jgi:hypothetical protein
MSAENLERAMGFEPTTPTLAIFGFMRQNSNFCDVSIPNDAEHDENTLSLRGHSADKLRTFANGFGGLA